MSIVQEKIQIPAGHSFRLLRWRENLRDVDVILGKGNRIRIVGEGEHWHYHEACELLFFESGTGTSFVGDRIQAIQAGDVMLLGSNLPHYWHMRGPSSGWLVQWHWESSHHAWALPETADLDQLSKDALRGIQYFRRSAERMAAIFHELIASEGLARLGHFLRMLAAAAEAPEQDRTLISQNSPSFVVGSRHQVAMQVIIRHLFENFRRQIRLEEVLDLAHMSKPTFSREFKKHAGMPLSVFLQQIRMEAVCHELVGTDHPITEVALNNGFTELSFFYQVFRRVHRCNPMEYRRLNRPQVPASVPRSRLGNGTILQVRPR
jgi:AraC-like DNA-binding protein